jgi:HAE1 family hydrophobic/amphiphilic exporter-1
MGTLPLAIIGVIFALFITDATISLFSLMAVVMLVGIVVNNGILIIEYTREAELRGTLRKEALIEACRERFRAIIMTAIATVLAMVPLALGMGAGGEMRAPMAIVSIGGLIVSTIMSFFVIPAAYEIVESTRDKIKLWRT